MSITDFHLVKILLISLVLKISASCLRSIPCPCGRKENLVFYTQCVNTTFDEKVACRRWANCETCEANIPNCLTCPPGYSGSSCTEILETLNTISCPYPEPKPNSRLVTYLKKYQIFLPSTQLEYACNEGFESRDPLIIFCMHIGDWSSPPPTCERSQSTSEETISCPFPELKPNSRLITSLKKYQILLPSTQLEYACNEGFESRDPLIIFCMHIGDWTSPPPTCERSQPKRIVDVLRTLINIRCPNPTSPQDGYMEYISSNGAIRGEIRFEVGSQVRFTCRRGYEIIGSSSLVCLQNGQWSSAPPTCFKYTTSGVCADLGFIDNGKLTIYNTNYQRNLQLKKETKKNITYPVGTRIIYECIYGYRLQGREVLNCDFPGRWSNKKPKCIEDCGRSSHFSKSSIDQGRSVQPGEFPWVVLISINGSSTFTGILLDRRTVLTVAHYLKSAVYCTLQFGKYNRSDTSNDESVEIRTSSQIIIHPEYNENTYDNDIAIVKFSPEVSYSARIQPICLPTLNSSIGNPILEQKGYLLGWSVNVNDLPSSSLMVTLLPIQDPETCSMAFRRRNQTLRVTPRILCGGFAKKRQDSCNGGSGSLLVLYNNETDRFTLEGIASHRVSGSCSEPEMYTIFVKVSYYVEWISQYVQK